MKSKVHKPESCFFQDSLNILQVNGPLMGQCLSKGLETKICSVDLLKVMILWCPIPCDNLYFLINIQFTTLGGNNCNIIDLTNMIVTIIDIQDGSHMQDSYALIYVSVLLLTFKIIWMTATQPKIANVNFVVHEKLKTK